MPKTPPTTFRAGGINWDLKFVSSDKHTEPQTAGYTVWEDATVYVANREQPGMSERTLLHELVHVADIQGLTELSESQVTRFSVQLWTILADNPQLVHYLFGGKRRA